MRGRCTDCLLDTDVLSFHVLGRSIIVLNSAKSAHELMDKRGARYADRPRFVLYELYVSFTRFSQLIN